MDGAGRLVQDHLQLKTNYASIAQLVEHLPLKQLVTGSSPVGGTIQKVQTMSKEKEPGTTWGAGQSRTLCGSGHKRGISL